MRTGLSQATTRPNEDTDMTYSRFVIRAYSFAVLSFTTSCALAQHGETKGFDLSAQIEMLAENMAAVIPSTSEREVGRSNDVIDRRIVFCDSNVLEAVGTSRWESLLSADSEVARIHASLALARMGQDSAVEQVKRLALESKNGFVRQAAVAVLGMIQRTDDPEIVPILEKALKDPFVYYIGDVGIGVSAEAAVQNYGKMAVWTNHNWELKDLRVDETN